MHLAGGAEQLEEAGGFSLTHDGDGIDFTGFEVRSKRLRGGFAKKNLRAVNTGGAFDAGGEVHGVANDGIAAEVLRADVAHDDFTGADPDAQVNGGRVLAQPGEFG